MQAVIVAEQAEFPEPGANNFEGEEMSEYYCSHKPPCCPKVEALIAERDRLKEEAFKWECRSGRELELRIGAEQDRDRWRTLAMESKKALI